NAASSGCSAEPVSIGKTTPGLQTSPSPPSGTPGTTLNDSATLSGGFNPTGSIDFPLFPPGDATCAVTPAFTQTATVSGNGTYSTTVGFVANVARTWLRTSPTRRSSNLNAASSGCSAEPVSIGKTTPGLQTSPSPPSGTLATTLNDAATLSGGF